MARCGRLEHKNAEITDWGQILYKAMELFRKILKRNLSLYWGISCKRGNWQLDLHIFLSKTALPFTNFFSFVLISLKLHIKQGVLGRTNRLLSLIRHGPHWKRRVQQFFYCGACIRYRGNVSTEPFPRNDRGIFTKPLTSNDKGDTQAHTRTQTATWSHKPTLFFQNKESRL
jgi:hypothetical protein